MSHIKLLDQKLEEYNIWLEQLIDVNMQIEENILQKDSKDKLQEMAVSIVISSAFVLVGAVIIGMTTIGLISGGLLFIIGWLFSINVNEKIFGTERSKNKLRKNEIKLLRVKDDFNNFIKPIQVRLKIKRRTKEISFTHYTRIKSKMNNLLSKLEEYDTSALSIKYKNRHGRLLQEMVMLTYQFDTIYTGKKGYFK
jgi:hypothetical protein